MPFGAYLTISPTLPFPAVAHLVFLFCCFVWGSSFILVERVTHAFAPVEIALWRLFGGAAFVGLCWFWTRGAMRLRRRDVASIAFAAIAFTAPPMVIQAYLVSQGHGHSFFGTMVAAIPLLTILVSVPMLGVRPSRGELFGVLGGLACLWLLVEDGFDRGMSLTLLGLTLLVPLSSALSNTFIKWKLHHVPAPLLTAALLTAAGLGLVPLQLSPRALQALEISGPSDPSVTLQSLVCLVLLSVVASGLSTMLFIWLILKKGPLFAGMATYVVPVVALLWGTVDNEMISFRQGVAIVGVLSMVALVQSTSRSSKRELPATRVEEAISTGLAVEPTKAVVPALQNIHELPTDEPTSQVA